jgi:hypothetical protein
MSEAGPLAALQHREPALLTAFVTMVGGFLAQAGPGHVPSLKALGTSVSISGLQGILTRERVFSPASVEAGVPASVLRSPTTWLAQGAEPALVTAMVGLFAGFLVQIVGGTVDLLQALGIAAGLSGTQGALTRPLVYSSRTAALKALAPAAHLGGMLESASAGSPAAATSTSSAVAVAALAVTQPDLTNDPELLGLLERFRPEVRYDSLESFFADSAAVITDRPGNVLKRHDGTVIATAGSATSALTLAFLQPTRYPNGLNVEATDYIDEVGNDYETQARSMHAQSQYANKVHGRVVVDGTGVRWVQYWLIYYYYDPGFLGFGTHEGDIEMIQLRLDARGQPDAASYAQHGSGLRASWGQLELSESHDGPVPVTYSARGSHANLLRSGQQVGARSFLPDHNDGDGPRVRPDLIVLSNNGAPWSRWPGTWGSTRGSGILGDVGIAANSPAALVAHRAWSDPAGFHASCDVADAVPPAGQSTAISQPAPLAPVLHTRSGQAGPVVDLQVPPDPGRPAATKVVVGLVATDAALPAITRTVNLRGPTETVELPSPPDDAQYEVRATAHAASGAASDTARAPL